MLIAGILALLFKKLPDDDNYKSKLIVSCGPVTLPNSHIKSHRERVLANRPPSKWLLASDRYQLQLDEKMSVIIRDVGQYTAFLVIALVNVWFMSDPNVYNQNVALNALFKDTLTNVKIFAFKCSLIRDLIYPIGHKESKNYNNI